MMHKSLSPFAALAVLALANASGAADPRIRYITFNNNAVVTVPAGLGVSTMIQLGSAETIETISAGDTASWSIVPKKGSGILFVKPLRENAETNVNIVTNQRVYALLLKGSAAEDLRAAFQVRFKYPDEDVNARLLAAAQESVKDPLLKDIDPSRLNYDYVFRGDFQPKAARRLRRRHPDVSGVPERNPGHLRGRGQAAGVAREPAHARQVRRHRQDRRAVHAARRRQVALPL
jgi:type IV secretion system protein VirB9